MVPPVNQYPPQTANRVRPANTQSRVFHVDHDLRVVSPWRMRWRGIPTARFRRFARGLSQVVFHSPRWIGPRAMRKTALTFPGMAIRVRNSHPWTPSTPGISPSRVSSQTDRWIQNAAAAPHTRNRSHLWSRSPKPQAMYALLHLSIGLSSWISLPLRGWLADGQGILGGYGLELSVVGPFRDMPLIEILEFPWNASAGIGGVICWRLVPAVVANIVQMSVTDDAPDRPVALVFFPRVESDVLSVQDQRLVSSHKTGGVFRRVAET